MCACVRACVCCVPVSAIVCSFFMMLHKAFLQATATGVKLVSPRRCKGAIWSLQECRTTAPHEHAKSAKLLLAVVVVVAAAAAAVAVVDLQFVVEEAIPGEGSGRSPRSHQLLLRRRQLRRLPIETSIAVVALQRGQRRQQKWRRPNTQPSCYLRHPNPHLLHCRRQRHRKNNQDSN